MEVFEETSELFGVIEEEADAIVSETPFQVFVKGWRKVEAERRGAEKSI